MYSMTFFTCFLIHLIYTFVTFKNSKFNELGYFGHKCLLSTMNIKLKVRGKVKSDDPKGY